MSSLTKLHVLQNFRLDVSSYKIIKSSPVGVVNIATMMVC